MLDSLAENGISRATYFNWRSKYGGVTVNDLKRMKELEAEALAKDHRLPIRRACQIVRLSRAAYYRTPSASMERDREVIEELNRLVASNGRWGFWKCYNRLRLDGYRWNHKRVHRVYRELRLRLPRRTRRRAPQRLRQPLAAPPTLNVIDESNREGLAIEIGTSIPSARVVRVMEQLIDLHGRSSSVRLDNGSERTAETFVDSCQRHDIELRYIQAGKPDQNAYIECFNRSCREEVLGAQIETSTRSSPAPIRSPRTQC